MKHYLSIAFCMLVWSTWGPMIRWIDLPPVVVLFYTSLVAGIAVPIVLRLRGELKLAVSRESWWLFAVLAGSSIVNNLTYFYALGNTTVSNAVFAHYLAPVLVAVFAPLMIAERLQRVTLISLPLAAAGLALIVFSGGRTAVGGGHTAGIVAGAISGVAYALLIVFSRLLSRMLMHHKAVVLLLWITIAATAPFALMTEHHLSARAISLFLVTGLVHSTAASLLYYNALRSVIAQYAAILGYLEPLFAVPLAYFFLHETPLPVALAGGALILASGYLVIRAGTKDNPQAGAGAERNGITG